jgi:hypothetical protein
VSVHPLKLAILFSSDPYACAQLTALAADLAAPPLRVGIGDLAALWRYDVVRAIAPLPYLMQDYPELSVRVRGAVGQAFAQLSAPVTASGRIRPHPWDIFFSPLAAFGPGRDVPRPLVVRASVAGRQLIVDVHIFGDAMAWTQDAAQALLLALRGGIALTGEPRAMRVSIEPEDILIRRVSGVSWSDRAAVRPTTLWFRTPVSVRHGRQLATNPSAILIATVRRVDAMARWLGVAVDLEGFDPVTAAAAVSLDTRQLDQFYWRRHSRRQGNIAIPVASWLGRLGLPNGPGLFTPWLALASGCNTGSHAGLGLGWMETGIVLEREF